ncbi:hypothetical protein CAEBREN_30259 [Caenorhabditis brenneri]|uniref:Sdz-33 F-box domain-containing protein n=1 Tax=Caenorhabditis brenneri TaxID=135651 RepID=G0N0B9_CAEBE|nr:hypothetical protein CAEBREN_30259 [Caenorhabditis brenneri]
MIVYFAHILYIVVPFQQNVLRIGFYERRENIQWGRRNNERKKLLKTSKLVTISFVRAGGNWERCVWILNHLEVREWTEHLQFLFPSSKSLCLNFGEQSFQFDIDSIKETFPNFSKLAIKHTGRFAFNQLLLQKLHLTEGISISSDCFEDSRIPHWFLIQNFSHTNLETPTALNDALASNSEKISFVNPQISLNIFIKLRMKGSNPNMELFFVVYRNGGGTTNRDVIMKGIEYQEMQDTLERFNIHMKHAVRGGMDIHRSDGTKATIRITSASFLVMYFTFGFIVCFVIDAHILNKFSVITSEGLFLNFQLTFHFIIC